MSTVKSAESHHQHHFATIEQQYDSSKQGIWLFLVTEILMFGGLFVAYSIYHSLYPEVFKHGSEMLDKVMGTTNTAVLIFSSFTMALGIHYVQTDKLKHAAISMGITIVCACIFLVVKYFEYSHKFHDGLLPGKYFTNEELANIPNAALFFGFYFMMTGLHGVHVFAGACMIGWCMVKALRGNVSSGYYTPVEGVGLFWHIVDLIWIYLFPLFYLVG